MIYIGLSILKVRYALFIGFIAGLFDIIPYFGPIIGFIPAAAFALLRSPISVLWVLAIFVLANQLESSIIAPKIIGDRVGLHPLAVIFAVLVGGELLGITGMLVAVPAASITHCSITSSLAGMPPAKPPGLLTTFTPFDKIKNEGIMVRMGGNRCQRPL